MSNLDSYRLRIQPPLRAPFACRVWRQGLFNVRTQALVFFTYTAHIKCSQSVGNFKSNLKAFLFKQAFN